MTAIVRSDPPERLVLYNTVVWRTRHYCSDGTLVYTYEENCTRGLCGLRNGDACQAPLGALHPQCVRCHELGHCAAMCPVEVPGFACTASLDPESQAARWGLLHSTPEAQYRRQEREACLAKAKAKFEANRADLDARFAALPTEFQARIQRRRDNNPDFRWEYESYELFCCEEAVKLAAACREALAGRTFSAVTDGEDAVRQWFTSFQALPYAAQRKQVQLDDGHSGNTFGCACRLAYLYLVAPASVPDQYGALAPLVGSKAYGDVAPEEAPT